MRSGGGKSKGASFEREICRHLSLWISRGTQEDVYWRSAMSGGRSTVAHAKGKRLAAQAGDISCIHSIGQSFADRFFIELKFYKDLEYTGLLSGRGNLANFWVEAKTQAQRYSKLPMLIAKQNRIPTMLCLDREGALVLGLLGRLVLIAPPLNLRIIPFEGFLKWANRV